MPALPFQNGTFTFYVSPGNMHKLTVRITPLLSLEWQLYVNGVDVAYIIDVKTNILISADIDRALSFSNVTSMYDKLLSEAKKPLP
jgi:hypothetical protein